MAERARPVDPLDPLTNETRGSRDAKADSNCSGKSIAIDPA